MREGRLALGVYRLVARVSALLLASTGCLESVLVHRSVATGEICFARSDIDLLLVLRPQAIHGRSLAALYRWSRLLKTLNPALHHLELYRPGGLAEFAARDSAWGSMERRSMRLLYGRPVTLPERKVTPLDALRRFLLWCETFYPAALQRHDARNLRKLALECWNFYAVAEGQLNEPLLRRSDMLARVGPDGLGEPGFVLALAARLHASRLPALPALREPLIFEASLAPYGFRRLFVVLPRPDWPLPPEAYRPGAFLATPELLDLYQQFRNGFLSWVVPPALGLSPPTLAGFRRDVLYYCDPRTLFFPGFADPRAPHPGPRLDCLAHAFDCLEADRLPPPRAHEQIRIPCVDSYYRHEYESLSGRSDALEARMRV